MREVACENAALHGTCNKCKRSVDLELALQCADFSTFENDLWDRCEVGGGMIDSEMNSSPTGFRTMNLLSRDIGSVN